MHAKFIWLYRAAARVKEVRRMPILLIWAPQPYFFYNQKRFKLFFDQMIDLSEGSINTKGINSYTIDVIAIKDILI